jgi:hypothetical protein
MGIQAWELVGDFEKKLKVKRKEYTKVNIIFECVGHVVA